MPVAELGAVGELVGGIAVVVTLVYLALQLRQTRKLSETSVHIALAANVASELQAVIPPNMADILVRSMESPAALQPRELIALDCWWGLYINNRQSEYREHRLGLYSGDAWSGFETMLREDLSTRFARNWWQHSGRFRVQQGFRDYVDALLGAEPVADEHYTLRLRVRDP